MSRKKIPKRRGGEKIEKKDLNEIFHLEIGLVSVFLLIGFFSLLFGALETQPIRNIINPTLAGQASTVCIDSDNGISALIQGTTKGLFNGELTEKTDECMSNTLKEYYCDILDCSSCIYSREINCKNNCVEGACT